MVHRLILTFLVGYAFLPVSVLAVETYEDIPEDVQVRIFRPCTRFDDADQVRCKAREAQKWRQKGTLNLPHKDFEFRDAQDFGQGHLRARLRAERRLHFQKQAATRRTYRQFQPTDDPNTRRRPYINDIRAERLRCMLLSPGRPRALCLDALANKARAEMREASATRKYPAQ